MTRANVTLAQRDGARPRRLRLWPAVAMALTLLSGPAADAQSMTEAQGEAILEELRRIRATLERLERQDARPRPAPRAAAQPSTATVTVTGRPILGRDDAPVTLVEFTDYQCPFCARNFRNVYPSLKADYVEQGKLRIVIKDLPLAMHPLARGAAKAAHCAGEQHRYWEMHDSLFANPGRLAAPHLRQHAVAIGLDADAFDACMASERHEASIDADVAEARRQGITGTPTFVLGNTTDGETMQGARIRGAQSLERFRSQIDGLLRQRGEGG